MSRTAAVFEVTFRRRGYTAEDERALHQALEDLGAVRLRPLQLPEAGGTAELWIVLSFIGGSMATGLIQHLTGKFYDRLAAQLLHFFRTKTQRDRLEPEMFLSVSYDDVDLIIGPLSERELRHIPAVAEKVHRSLNEPPLKDAGVTKIVLGMVREAHGWSEPHLQNLPEDGNRFWGISLEAHRQVTHVFDTTTGLLAERPDL